MDENIVLNKISNTVLGKLKNQIVISVQSAKGEPLYDEICMIAMMKSVVNGGAKALRLAGTRDIKNARELFPEATLIGITKPDKIPENFTELVYITPTIEEVKKVIEADADIVAFDGTMRKRPDGSGLKDIIDFIKNSKKLSMADISTYEEGLNACSLGVDIISTTLSGYTKESISNNQPETPDFELLSRLVHKVNCPVILEGRIWTPEDVVKSFELGAFAVVVGSMVTRPGEIVKRLIRKGLKG